ncbi:hypothetical protein [Streptobacillus moniliformis]|uniref:Uncharacterized protein n=2 Tax=Streptobacillus moniliformis TaxID=34105 RepID=D1AW54_STRM9|nr:hypothetical protein [Streptobacillus moniliformis]ACZ00530.1 hypothetical protein Smon_0032 [Streptobacillus moniliformis DSM 12112]AVL43053.1 hypothetical protein CEP89_04085 [Streptobacillus moniliformis]SQA12824.1 Uncharacterised protein [Streptobacillus moniliformis]
MKTRKEKYENEKYFKKSEYMKDFEESFENIKIELKEISEKLFNLLPDKSINSEEKIERLARLIPESIMESEFSRTGRTKLNIIRRKLDYLVPNPNLNYFEKIDYLVSIANNLVPDKEKLIEKLEEIDDFRRTDNGRLFVSEESK